MQLSTISIKILARFFIIIDKIILKFIWKDKGTRIAKTILKKNKIEVILPNFKTYNITTLIKTVPYIYWKDRHIDRWNRIEKPEVAPQKYIQLISDRDVKVIQWRKMGFSNKGTRTVRHP